MVGIWYFCFEESGDGLMVRAIRCECEWFVYGIIFRQRLGSRRWG
jgi:hypothetical protein